MEKISKYRMTFDSVVEKRNRFHTICTCTILRTDQVVAYLLLWTKVQALISNAFIFKNTVNTCLYIYSTLLYNYKLLQFLINMCHLSCSYSILSLILITAFNSLIYNCLFIYVPQQWGEESNIISLSILLLSTAAGTHEGEGNMTYKQHKSISYLNW